MLQVYTKQGWLPISERNDYYTEYEYGGDEILHFSISPKDPNCEFLLEECDIKNEENLYTIKKRNQLRSLVSYDCELNLDDWKATEPYRATKNVKQFQMKTLTEILEYIKPKSWKIVNSSITDQRITLDMECVNAFDILWKLTELFDIAYRFEVLHKTVEVLHPQDMRDKGLYITKELNMEGNTIKADSSGFVTRLYCEGKDGLSFAAVNGGKNYVECHTYSDKVITGYWKDTAIDQPQKLLDQAKKKIEELAVPVISYTVEVKDLARMNKDYEFLNFGLYDLAHILMEQGQEVMQRVIKVKKYHDVKSQSVLTLSSAPQKINKQIQKISSSLNEDGITFEGSIVQQAQQMATDMIVNAMGGYVLKTRNELFILDTDDPNSARKVWRWNMNGLGYSSYGIQGPYELAMTSDGQIVADRITTGILRTIQLHSCTIQNGSKFSVDRDGNMKCHDAEISGTFTASTFIGGILKSKDGNLVFDLINETLTSNGMTIAGNGSNQINFTGNGDKAATFRSDDGNAVFIFFETGDAKGRIGTYAQRNEIFIEPGRASGGAGKVIFRGVNSTPLKNETCNLEVYGNLAITDDLNINKNVNVGGEITVGPYKVKEQIDNLIKAVEDLNSRIH